MGTSKADATLLDNAVWHALRGPQSSLAQTDASGRAARFDPEVSPFAAVEHLDASGWQAQAELVGKGVAVLFRDAVPSPPPGWQELARIPGLQMILAEPPPASDIAVVPLGCDDVSDMLALTQVTEPGPFLPRTIEMGRYVGVRRDRRLVAMAGERMRLPGWTEVSAVCTHLGARRQGFGAALTLRVAAAICERGERPFLHVVASNENAIRLYLALGFAIRRTVEAVAVQWVGPGSVRPS